MFCCWREALQNGEMQCVQELLLCSDTHAGAPALEGRRDFGAVDVAMVLHNANVHYRRWNGSLVASIPATSSIPTTIFPICFLV